MFHRVQIFSFHLLPTRLLRGECKQAAPCYRLRGSKIYSQIKHETELKPTLHIGWIQETFLWFSRFSGVCGMYSSGCEALSCRQHFILSNSCAAERQPRMSLSHKVSRWVKTSVQKIMSMGVSLLKALDMRYWLHTCLLLMNRP